jgi:lactate dehydrogenase-like 2-hydroxyacid dehydrogenase
MAGEILVLIPLPPATLQALERLAPVLQVSHMPTDKALREVRMVVTNGTTGLDAAAMARLPRLGLVCAYGVGHEGVDTAEAARRGVRVTNAPNTNGDTVADHAFALMLALSRRLVPLQAAIRGGAFEDLRKPLPTLSGASLGIVGMGNVGRAIARRARGFDMAVRYVSRSAVDGTDAERVADMVALAEASDYLVACCPGGPATHHLVDARVLEALGTDGFLVNVARGSVVDSEALADALAAGALGGAGLDVWEDEPVLPSRLAAFDNVVLSPHMAGRSPVGARKQREALLANVSAWLGGSALNSVVV